MNRTRIAPVLVFFGLFCAVAHAGQPAWDQIRERAADLYGDRGAAAAAFLNEHRPERDADIDPQIVVESIGIAIAARERYPWAAAVPEQIWLNDVLPYAVLDEPRALTRARMREIAAPIVEGAATAEEAAQRLNRDLFSRVGVRYSTQRRRANQNAIESMEIGLASCTGLSILLVDACRSVGIPARVAGIAAWTDRNGNHTWVEIHDGERWRFTGAAEHDPNGLDRGWFVGAATQGVPGHELHAIWASSWQSTGDRFPLAWDMDDRSVPGVDVTHRYARPKDAGTDSPRLLVRLWESRGGVRIAADASITHDGHTRSARTHADPDDINRTAEFDDPGVRPLRVHFVVDGRERTALIGDEHRNGTVAEVYWNELALSRDEAEALAHARWKAHAEAIRSKRSGELAEGVVRAAGHEMKFLRRDFGEAPETGRSLWISMHGGGGTTAQVNDQQWRNQIRLYEPAQGIYIAPRAPSDTWNLWHRPEIDRLFDWLIESAVVVWGVDPDRVYLLGYSAGGDGVYQLAPRMADRFAAAAMMAGHPNDADPAGLRNLPFALFMGADDSAYNRNAVAEQWGGRLAELHAADPSGYRHLVRIYPDLGHWMNGKDAEAIPWMAGFARHPWPDTVVWRLSGPFHSRFYWLSVPEAEAAKGRRVRASVGAQTITVNTEDFSSVELWLSDALIDLDRTVRVIANGEPVFEGTIPRTEAAIDASLRARPDPAMVATARLTVAIPPAARTRE